MNVLDSIARQAGTNPGQPALIARGQILSYRQLWTIVGARAQALQAHGVGRGDCVAVSPLIGPGAYLVAVLGEIPDRVQALRELRRVLRRGGVLSITETLTDPDYQLEDSVRDVCRAVGFEPLEHVRGLLGYTMNFRA